MLGPLGSEEKYLLSTPPLFRVSTKQRSATHTPMSTITCISQAQNLPEYKAEIGPDSTC